MNQIYCVKCHKFTETRDVKHKTTKKQPSNSSRHLCCLWNEKVKVYKHKWKGVYQ